MLIYGMVCSVGKGIIVYGYSNRAVGTRMVVVIVAVLGKAVKIPRYTF